MDVKEAVSVAKKYTLELFADEGLRDLGLEEIRFDPDHMIWRVTIGFSRPWEGRGAMAALVAQPAGRSLKVVTVSDRDGTVISVQNRED